jgi:hypothetical protein
MVHFIHDTNMGLSTPAAVDIVLSKIDIRTKKGSKKTNVLCDPNALVEDEQDTLGFHCANGPFIATQIQKPDICSM